MVLVVGLGRRVITPTGLNKRGTDRDQDVVAFSAGILRPEVLIIAPDLKSNKGVCLALRTCAGCPRSKWRVFAAREAAPTTARTLRTLDDVRELLKCHHQLRQKVGLRSALAAKHKE